LSGAGVYRPSDNPGCVDNAALTNPPTRIIIQEGSVNSANPAICLQVQSGPISLPAGASAIVYYKLPVNLISPSDSGLLITVGFIAGSAPVSQAVRIGNP